MTTDWRVAPPVPDEVKRQFPELHPLTLQLLWNRGIFTQEAMERFLTPDYLTDSYDPFLFVDMQKAVDRILVAVQQKESVAIFGDYDADGVSASAILFTTIKKMGIEPHVHLPHRELEGYGLNMKAAKEFVERNISVVITCDCGISNADEVAYLQDNGIDVIVTDHHEEPKVLPKSFATLNPHLSRETYPFKHLVGTGVAFKLAQALISTCQKKQIGSFKEGEEKWLLDLVSIATIADYGPLVGENRTFTKFGLVVLERTRRVGIRALVELARLKFPAEVMQVAFQIVPRLNAASRMEHANSAFSLLVATSEDEAIVSAKKLDTLNKERQKKSDAMFEDCLKQIGENPQAPLLIAQGEGWGAGMLGLVAGKLLHRFNKPVIVIGLKDDVCVASGRSIPSFDITKALEKNAKLLLKFGGHPQACGLSFDRKQLDAVSAALLVAAKQVPQDESLTSTQVDVELPLDEVTWELWDELKQFGPFGEGNPRPVFVARDVVVQGVRSVGASGKHLQVVVKHNGGMIKKTIAFGFAPDWKDQLPQGTSIDILFEISLNEWNGNRELQISLKDIALHAQ